MIKIRPKKKPLNHLPFSDCHLYGIKSPHTLAKRIGRDLEEIELLAQNGGYSVYPHPQTKRIIEEPGEALQKLHKQLHRYLSRVQVPDYLHSAVKGRSYLSNARAHLGDGGLIKVDISKFYRSVKQEKVVQFFRDVLNCAPDVAGLIANLICYDGHLATGSSVSPIISYFAFKNMFDSLYILATKNDLRMTCYVDDVAMSGKNASYLLLHEARSIISREGLKAHKERFYLPNKARVVTGVIVNSNEIHLPFARWSKIDKAISEIEKCSDKTKLLTLYPRLVSRLYEAAQIEPRCRKLANHFHQEWKNLKNTL